MEENEKWQRKISLTIEDIGNGQFTFKMEGDCERIGLPSVPTAHYTPAEFWAMNLFAVCQDHLQRHGDTKLLNREERRAGKELSR